MDDDIKKHAMLLFVGIVICALINIKLSTSKLKKIKKPMRERVAILCEMDATVEVLDSDEMIADLQNKKKNNTNDDVVQISKIDYVDDLSNKETWNEFLNSVYERLVSQESVIVCVKPSNLAQISALIKGCFEAVNKPVVIVSNDADLNDAKVLISKLTSSYIVTIVNHLLLKPEDVSNNSVICTADASDFKERLQPILSQKSSDVFLKRPDTTPNINILKLYPGMDYEKTVYCTLSYSNGIIIDNRLDAKLRLDLQDDEAFANRIVLVVGKNIKVTSPNLQVLHDAKISPEYALVKMFTN